MNLIRSVFRAAIDVGALEQMPSLPKYGKQGRKLPDAPSDDEVRAMLSHADGWLRTAIALAAFAGLRMGEVRALEVHDIDRRDESILIRRALSEKETLPPKSGHERAVPLAPELATLLAAALRDKLPQARIVLNAYGRTPGRQHVLTSLNSFSAAMA